MSRSEIVVGEDGKEAIKTGFDGDGLMFGFGGGDILDGGAGNGALNGGTDDNILDGGSENDALSYLDAKDKVMVSLAVNGPQTTTPWISSDGVANIANIARSDFEIGDDVRVRE
jgi:Ca2+-binding RTX toxin-like protein